MAELEGTSAWRSIGRERAPRRTWRGTRWKDSRPRARGFWERFESRVLPLFERQTKEGGRLLPELCLHGLLQGDLELALRGLLGEGAPLSASSIERLRGKWQQEYDDWSGRPLHELRLVYLWADGVYVKAGLRKEKAALLAVIGATVDERIQFHSNNVLQAHTVREYPVDLHPKIRQAMA